ncbi:hypothetical protein QTJ16_003325 [Diplocarpon rosae]|uniref:Pentatricopeptide repeat domain-containing protein n=1 Tax=Diplocarpon rosae TaxID=946125 RepID=A0AAD9T250_9HELO|nr:hypothetical protein QTJ16_003325 [Diplocarpon rosae]
MKILLFELEAIESRIASCPRGVPNRVHALRLRRFFNISHQLLVASRQAQALQELADGYFTNSRNIVESVRCTVVEKAQVPGHKQPGKSEVKIEPVEAQEAPEYKAWRENISRYIRVQARPRWRATKGAFGDALPVIPFDSYRASPASIEEQKQALISALRTEDPHAVMQVVLSLADLQEGVPSMLLSLSPASFSEVLRCMDPKHFVGRQMELYKTVSTWSMRSLGLSKKFGRDEYNLFSTLFLSHVKNIMDARQRKWPFTLSDYKYMLRCARSIGHAGAAEEIWRSLTKPVQIWRDPVTKTVKRSTLSPDTECYNLYLDAKCWGDNVNPDQRQRLRVIPDNLIPRHWDKVPHTLGGHRVGLVQGVKRKVAKVFQQMITEGVLGNEETFRLLIIAFAREGDMAGVEAILKRVWAIDVPTLMTTNDPPPAMRYDPRSPFYPSRHFLFTLCHAYGINNNIPAALRLVDHVSRQYSIPVPIDAWEELLEWTFVLTRKKSTSSKRYDRERVPMYTGREIGQLPPQAVTSLWQTMISEPYNVQPTLKMYNVFITNLAYRQRFGEMQKRMEEAREVLKKDVLALSRKNVALNTSIRHQAPKHIIEKQVRDYVLAHLHVGRNRQYVKRWVRLLLSQGTKHLWDSENWLFQTIPDIVRKWSLFLPDRIRYQVLTGEVSLNGQIKEEQKRRAIRRAQRGVGTRRLAMDGPLVKKLR